MNAICKEFDNLNINELLESRDNADFWKNYCGESDDVDVVPSIGGNGRQHFVVDSKSISTTKLDGRECSQDIDDDDLGGNLGVGNGDSGKPKCSSSRRRKRRYSFCEDEFNHIDELRDLLDDLNNDALVGGLMINISEPDIVGWYKIVVACHKFKSTEKGAKAYELKQLFEKCFLAGVFKHDVDCRMVVSLVKNSENVDGMSEQDILAF